MADVSRRSTALVGRSSELHELEELLDATTERVAIVSGDAGVGKTRLLTELIDRADQRGITVLVGQCLDFGDAGLPYLPFSDAFGRLAANDPDFVGELVTRLPAIERLLPSARAATNDGDEHRIDRAALYDSVLAALEAAAERNPVLLLIEDTHWADPASRDLLGFLLARVRSPRLSVVVSYRSDDLHRRHPLRRALGEWTRLPRVRRIHLAPLSDDEVRSLVTAISPIPLTEHEFGRIAERAGGNAFFVEELVSAAAHGGMAEALPAELADLLLIRLDRLSDAARSAVRAVAVAGGRVIHDTIASVLAVGPDELDAALREAVDGYVLETVGEAGYGFRHALLGEAVYDDLLPGERVRLHAAFARVLREDTSTGSAAELAHHARRSHDLTGAFEASVRAGDEAMHMAAPREAMQQFEAALELLGSVPRQPTAAWLRLVIGASDATSDAGHPYRALAIVRDALDGRRAALDSVDEARLLLTLARRSLNLDLDSDALAATSEALRLVPPDPPTPLRARVAALHAHAAIGLGRDVDASVFAQEAIEMAGALDQPEIAADARTTLALIERRVGDPRVAAEQFSAAADQAHAAGEISAELRSRFNLASLHFELGDLPAALDVYRGAADRARTTGRPWAAYAIEARALAGLTQYELGDWDGCLATVDTAGQDPPGFAGALLSAVSLSVRAGRGDPAVVEVKARLRSRWEDDAMIANLSGGAAIDALTAGGQPDAALAVIDDLVPLLAKSWQRDYYLGRIRLSALGLAALAADLVERSAQVGQRAVDCAAAFVEAGRRSASDGLPAGRRLGVEGVAWLARLEAESARVRWLAGIDVPDLDEHLDLWRRSVDAFGYGQVYEQARSRARLADVLRAGGRTDEAVEQAAQAREVARRLGAEPLLAELRRLAVPMRGEDERPELTPRERDVLALLVEGRTNRQVARQLYISEKTVSVHVSNLMSKLGVRSRAEAAALARREGLA